MSLTCQRSFGPSFGHSFSRPVSLEIPVRSGPRHWGQSAARAAVARVNPTAAEVSSTNRFACNLDMTILQSGEMRNGLTRCAFNTLPFVKGQYEFDAQLNPGSTISCNPGEDVSPRRSDPVRR